MARQPKKEISEPSVIVKPIGRYGGLDSIHLALGALVVVLILLLLFVSYSKPLQAANATTTAACQNGSCTGSVHNQSQIKLVAEKLLASYSSVNGSFSTLPYFSDVQAMNLSYAPSSRSWYVTVPVSVPNSPTVYFSAIISDLNTSQVTTFIQAVKPGRMSSDYVVSSGVVRLPNQPGCASTNPVTVYWFDDPYAPGGVSTLSNLTNLEQRFGGRVNVSLKILYTGSFQHIASSYGQINAQALGAYLFCASSSGTANFSDFVSKLSTVYLSAYISPAELANVSRSAGLNTSSFNSCVSNYSNLIPAETQLAQYYGVTSSPQVVTNCEYLSIPQTAGNAVCYTNSTLC